MCSIFDQLPHFHRSNLTTNSEDPSEWCAAFSYIARLVAYIAVLALIALILLVILKCLAESGDDQAAEENLPLPPPPATETTPLRPEKRVPVTYRAYEEGADDEDDDIEAGSCSSSSSEELYDGKICVICYDEERNCFFVPCGHCATCYSCAQRILEGDSGKTCPVCRRLVRRVRKWFTS